MFRYYNAHPTGRRTGDCVKRAIAVTTGMDYRQVEWELNRYKSVTGAEKYNAGKNPHRYAQEVLKAEVLPQPEDMTVGRFADQHCRGRFILDLEGHWSCCIDGVIYDSWDCSGERLLCAYAVTSFAKEQAHRFCCTSQQLSEREKRLYVFTTGMDSFLSGSCRRNLWRAISAVWKTEDIPKSIFKEDIHERQYLFQKRSENPDSKGLPRQHGGNLLLFAQKDGVGGGPSAELR